MAKARAQGRRIATCEIDCLPRLSGRSKVANWRNIVTYLDEIRRIRASRSSTRRWRANVSASS